MGIINHDPYLLDFSGELIVNTYYHLVRAGVSIEKTEDGTFTSLCMFDIHYNKAAAEQQRPAIGSNLKQLRYLLFFITNSKNSSQILRMMYNSYFQLSN